MPVDSSTAPRFSGAPIFFLRILSAPFLFWLTGYDFHGPARINRVSTSWPGSEEKGVGGILFCEGTGGFLILRLHINDLLDCDCVFRHVCCDILSFLVLAPS